MIYSRAIRRFLMPSLTLGLYVAKTYTVRFLAMLLGLVAVLQLLDLLAHSDEILMADGAGWEQILYYLRLRAPQLISQFTPFSALLATLLTLATLNQNSEIIIMKAAGLSAHRILIPLAIPCLLIATIHFGFDNYVVARASSQLQYWQQNDYVVQLPPAPEYAAFPRLSENNLLILAESATRRPNVVILDNVSLYERDDTGKLLRWTKADLVVYVDNSWTMFAVNSFDTQSYRRTFADSSPAPFTLAPERFLMASLEPDFLSYAELSDTIENIESDGGSSEALLASLYHKITGPLSTLLMPLLGAIAGFGIHRAGSLLIRAVIGMALGFTFFIADNFMMAMGEFGVAPPLLASAAPIVLFTTVGLAVLFFTEE
jgi:lipopolysaccharide export system permease protein